MSSATPTATRLSQLLDELGEPQRFLCRELPSAPAPNTVSKWFRGKGTPTATQWQELVTLSRRLLPPSKQLSEYEAAVIKYETELMLERGT